MNRIIFVFLLLAVSISAQERNYWNIMGGTRSALMGGIVIGGVRDNSASFYNPGALGFINTSSHSISSDVYGYSLYRIKDGAGDGLNIIANDFKTLPLMASGLISLDFLIDDLKIGYVLLTRNKSALNFTSRVELYQDLIPQNPNGIYIGNDSFIPTFSGEENVTAQYLVSQSSEEIWGGGSLSQKINDNLSVGISGFGIYKTYSFRENINVFAVDTSYFQTASNSLLRYQDIWSLALLVKIGLAYQNDFIKLGLTLTSPQISIYGQSKVAGILSSQNVLRDADSQSGIVTPIDFTADDRQQDLFAKVKTPFSIGFGFETPITNKLNFSFGAEYFAPHKQYTVSEPWQKTFVLSLGSSNDIESNSAENLKIVDEFKSVLNFGFALEFAASEVLKTFFSFRTDYNNGVYKQRNNYYLGFSEWDIYHFTLGATFNDSRSDFSLGLGYSLSFDDNYNQLVNFSNLQINDEIYLFNQPKKAKLNYQDISIILGYTYNLE